MGAGNKWVKIYKTNNNFLKNKINLIEYKIKTYKNPNFTPTPQFQ